MTRPVVLPCQRDSELDEELPFASLGRISALSDLAANLFCVFMAVLITLLARPAQAPVPIAGETWLHKVLSGPERVNLLHARSQAGDRQGLTADGPAPPWLRIDLFAGLVRVIDAQGQSETYGLDTPGLRNALDRQRQRHPDSRIVLYLGSNDGYSQLRQALGQAAIDEVTIPEALLNGPGGDATDWSEGFAALLRTRHSRDVFTSALSRLLDAGPSHGQSRTSPGNIQAGTKANVSLVERIGHALKHLGLWLALAGSLVFIAVVERRHHRKQKT